ncbi:B-cell antigen receptor complex-associated protein alpha chain [Pundamilia nyererei]|uniref:B-cell antigen receptor complex-associated protein alpha chain n=1 Tax=Pundamilia nyererei TaxID=303518 RepID=A0A3B4GBJ8_9CICH|nr:PREDICTED: B-cell antigen receptor complex-associated protein alpha chain [Pundamilia nyererei]
MGMVVIFVLSSLVVGFAWGELILEPDRPSLSVPVSENASLECCYKSQSGRVNVHWIHYYNKTQQLLFDKTAESQKDSKSEKIYCAQLNFPEVKLKDLGFYHCLLNDSGNTYYTHGTYLRVYKPMEKTINLRETTKNKILIAEGFLLLLCVMLPSAILLFKSKKLNELEKKKAKKEEENIYQGLNLDDCCATYDQIERSQAQGPYQDVGNIKEEEEEIQLEKP